MKLSLEYFGAKRTGDLMARIGSESDRICLYLSLNLFDFATDVLMLAMISGILFFDQRQTGVGDLAAIAIDRLDDPVMRDKLRNGFEKIDRAWSELSSALPTPSPVFG